MHLVPVQHCSPDVKVKWVEVWRVGRPLVLVDKFSTMLLQVGLSLAGRMSWSSVLLKDEVILQECLAVSKELRKQLFSVKG